jgi:hypothetical protein
MKNRIKQKPIDSSEIEKYFNEELKQKWDYGKVRERLCDYTSLVNYHLKGFDMAWGTIWVWCKRKKKYIPMFAHHTWNLDSEDNVYDDFYSLNEILKYNNINSVNPEKDSIRYVDDFKVTKVNRMQISERLKKKFKKSYSKPKMIFLSEVGWDRNDNLHNWKSMEKKWSEIEKEDIIKEIQR